MCMFMAAQHCTDNLPSPVAAGHIQRRASPMRRAPPPWTSWLRSCCTGAVLLMTSSGCESTDAESVTRALGHAKALVAIANQDVSEVRQGLPAGADVMAKSWAAG